jgi:hypothetical protein
VNAIGPREPARDERLRRAVPDLTLDPDGSRAGSFWAPRAAGPASSMSAVRGAFPGVGPVRCCASIARHSAGCRAGGRRSLVADMAKFA